MPRVLPQSTGPKNPPLRHLREQGPVVAKRCPEALEAEESVGGEPGPCWCDNEFTESWLSGSRKSRAGIVEAWRGDVRLLCLAGKLGDIGGTDSPYFGSDRESSHRSASRPM